MKLLAREKQLEVALCTFEVAGLRKPLQTNKFQHEESWQTITADAGYTTP